MAADEDGHSTRGVLMFRLATLATLTAVLALPAGTALADHPSAGSPFETSTSTTGANAGPDGATWEIVRTFLSANPFTDLDVFTHGGEMYASVGTLAAGLNGGQTIIQLTQDGEVAPRYVSSHPSASCVSDPAAALGLQHDAEAAPKGDVVHDVGWDEQAVERDAELIIDATDNQGRCHDQGPALGLAAAPQGGLEIVDITDIENPVEIALTSHIGEAHTVNVDPSRPHIAYAVTSDSVTVSQDNADIDGDGDTEELIRENEDPEDSDRFDLDGFEVVDLSSCMGFPADATVEQKRGIDPTTGEFMDGEGCRPEVYRYRFELGWTQGTFNWDSQTGCHELEIHPNDLLTCAAPDGTLVLDMSGAFDANGGPRGTPLPCRVRASTSPPTWTTAAPVIDCVVGEGEADLSVAGWLGTGAPSLEGVRLVGFVNHGGRAGGATANNAGHSPTEDIAVAHESELTHSRRFVVSSDERGGGVVPPDAACPVPGQQPAQGNGGLHAFRLDELHTEYPGDPLTEEPQAIAERARASYALTPDGEQAIYRATPRVPAPSLCTAHVFQQIPGQNRIFMGWYTQGTQVVDYIEHPDGTFEWREAGWFIPEHANTWVSRVFQFEDNGDGTFTYYGVTGDFNAGYGRNAIDVWKATLPAPPQMAAGTDEEPASEPEAEPEPEPDASPLPTTGTTDGYRTLAASLLATSALAALALRIRRRPRSMV